MTIWREDFEKIMRNTNSFNELFPHTDILFSERNKKKYIIDNTVVFKELPQGKKPKGNYDIFYAFGIEYPSIICNLLREGNISVDTFRKIKQDNLEFVAKLYYSYCIRKNYSSYDLSGLERMFGVYYTKRELIQKTVSSIVVMKINSLVKR